MVLEGMFGMEGKRVNIEREEYRYIFKINIVC